MGDQDKPTTSTIPGLPGLLDQHNVQVASQKAADSQSRARRDDTELSDLGFGADPDYVRNEEHFEGMTLEAMYAAVHGDTAGTGGLDAAGLQTMRRTWFECCSELENLSTFNLMGLNRIFGNGLWQGVSGSAAQTASQQYSAVANQIGRVFETMSHRLDSLAWAAEAVRIAVPSPPSSVVVGPDPDNTAQSVLPGLINPEYSDQVDKAREEARQAAIRALNTVYKQTFPPAGSGVPTYATVPQLGANGDPRAGNGADSGVTGASPGKSGDPSAPETTTAPDASTPTATQPSGTGSTDTSAAGVRTPDAASNGPNTTTAPAGVSNSPGAPATSGLTGVGRGTHGLDGPGASPRTGGPGSSVPGTPGATASGTASPAAGAAAAARTGMGTTGPMAPGAGARRKDGEGDGEHHAPDYLRGVASDWTEGLDTPVEVIGESGLPEADPFFVSPEPTPIRSPAPPTPMFVEPARTEPETKVTDDLADTLPASYPGGSAPKDADAEASPASSAGFTGTGPSLDNLFAEYGWSADDSSSASSSAAGADARTNRLDATTETRRSGTE